MEAAVPDSQLIKDLAGKICAELKFKNANLNREKEPPPQFPDRLLAAGFVGKTLSFATGG